MHVVFKLCLATLVAVIAYVCFSVFDCSSPKVPVLEDIWWAPGKKNGEEISAVTPFSINVSDSIINDLKYRLNHHIPFQPPLENVKQWYGINTNLLQTVVDYWRYKYNWSDRQKFLNQFPQFKTQIQGLDIHFIHVKPKISQGLKVIPLLISHGWPGSVREFYEILPLLTTPQKGKNFVFEVIAPSLPGYGFSDGAVRPGLGPVQIGLIFRILMLRLGHEKFYLQGGDWGSVILQHLSIVHPENVIGLHSNFYLQQYELPIHLLKFFLGSFAPSLIMDQVEEEKNYPLPVNDLLLESGYFHLQATKPDTISVALRDSPVGLAAYILEKFTTGTNKAWRDREDGGLTDKFTMDQLLDNVMIYWVTRSKTTAARLYAEYSSSSYQQLGLNKIPIKVPSGFSRFPNEAFFPPKAILEDKFHNLVYVKDPARGGHFAALEEPELLAEDLFSFVEIVENLSNGKSSEL